jgi:hypothetical protein
MKLKFKKNFLKNLAFTVKVSFLARDRERDRECEFFLVRNFHCIIADKINKKFKNKFLEAHLKESCCNICS